MDNSDLIGLDAEALRNKYVEMVLLHEKTLHIGQKNRVFGWKHEIGKRLIAIGAESAREAMPLLEHPSEAVRFAAAYLIKPFNRELFINLLEGLAGHRTEIGRDARFALSWLKSEEERASQPSSPAPAPDPNWLRIVHWQENNPPPAAMSRAHFEDRVLTEFSASRAPQILALTRPAIGLWPQHEAFPVSPLSSRHGGDLWAPPDFEWPICDEEPLYFLGQIHCPDLAGLPGADQLPPDGMLTFFGDFDVISGCGPGGDAEQGAVYHWSMEGLVLTEPPLPLDKGESSAIPIVFRPFPDLPDRGATIVKDLALSAEERELYDNLRNDVRRHGIPEDVAGYCDYSDKLLGWPDLVQNDDFDLPDRNRHGYRLLAQLPARMGPGGSIYFFVTDADLIQRRFNRCIINEQNT